MKGSSAAHTELVHSTMLLVGALPWIRCWKRVVGLFYRVRFDNDGRVLEAVAVQVGTPGEPDIDGILTRWDGAGIRFGCEIKTGQATQSAEQRRYERMLSSMGGIYLVARSPEEALDRLLRERDRGKPT